MQQSGIPAKYSTRIDLLQFLRHFEHFIQNLGLNVRQ